METKTPPRILVVEDVPEMMQLVITLLQSLYPHATIASGKNVWEGRLEVRRHRPDLLILDEVLPGESSYDLLVEAHGKSIPVLLMSSMEGVDPGPVPPEARGRLQKPQWDTLKFEEEAWGRALGALL